METRPKKQKLKQKSKKARRKRELSLNGLIGKKILKITHESEQQIWIEFRGIKLKIQSASLDGIDLSRLDLTLITRQRVISEVETYV